jgi:hypothetical protein
MMYESIPSNNNTIDERSQRSSNQTCAITMDLLPTGTGTGTDTTSFSKEKTHSNMEKGLGVSLAFGMMTSLILGPILGLVLAGSCMYTSTREDKYGESVRYCGDSVLFVLDKSIDTCRKCNVDDIMPLKQRKHVSETISAASEHAIKQLQDLDAKFGVTSRASKWMGMKQHEMATLPIANTSTSSTPLQAFQVPMTSATSHILEYENESEIDL